MVNKDPKNDSNKMFGSVQYKISSNIMYGYTIYIYTHGWTFVYVFVLTVIITDLTTLFSVGDVMLVHPNYGKAILEIIDYRHNWHT